MTSSGSCAIALIVSSTSTSRRRRSVGVCRTPGRRREPPPGTSGASSCRRGNPARSRREPKEVRRESAAPSRSVVQHLGWWSSGRTGASWLPRKARAAFPQGPATTLSVVDERERPLRRGDLDPDPLAAVRALVRGGAGGRARAGGDGARDRPAGGAPSVRMVLLKRFDASGLVFHTHYTSRKGRELEANPQAALLFSWDPLGRQVRVEGPVGAVARRGVGRVLRHAAARRADRRARLGAERRRRRPRRAGAASRRARAAVRGDDSPRPEWWGGYRVVPETWEFWQHRDSRLHDRFRYRPRRGRLADRAARRPSWRRCSEAAPERAEPFVPGGADRDHPRDGVVERRRRHLVARLAAGAGRVQQAGVRERRRAASRPPAASPADRRPARSPSACRARRPPRRASAGRGRRARRRRRSTRRGPPRHGAELEGRGELAARSRRRRTPRPVRRPCSSSMATLPPSSQSSTSRSLRLELAHDRPPLVAVAPAEDALAARPRVELDLRREPLLEPLGLRQRLPDLRGRLGYDDLAFDLHGRSLSMTRNLRLRINAQPPSCTLASSRSAPRADGRRVGRPLRALVRHLLAAAARADRLPRLRGRGRRRT